MEIKTDKELSDLLRNIHGEKKISELSKKSDMSPTTISYWKRGIDLNFNQAIKLAQSMGHNIIIKID